MSTSDAWKRHRFLYIREGARSYMTNVRKPDFTLHREMGRTTYCIHGYFKQDSETTYADQLLMLIRNAAAKENQVETEIKQEKEIA